MPSPFLGIDPYLESQDLWRDFRIGFIGTLRTAINEQLPEAYVARIEESMKLIEVPQEQVRQVRSDVNIPRKFLEEYREIFLKILHLPEGKVVTIVELLSPQNKAGISRRDYLSWRSGLLTQEVHMLELDFLVGGDRLPMDHPLPRGDYYALISRAQSRPMWDVWVLTIRDPLPTIPIPLLAPDPDLRVDLAPLFASVYERARYARSIDYRADLTLPLAPEDRAWAEERARGAAG